MILYYIALYYIILYMIFRASKHWESLLEYSHVPFSEEAPKSPMRINFLHKGARFITASKQG